jgi:tRNA (guanine9-N1)-methyltransferase
MKEASSPPNDGDVPGGIESEEIDPPVGNEAPTEEEKESSTEAGSTALETKQGGEPQKQEARDETEQESTSEPKKISKNQLKRQRKWEQAMVVKRRRKQQEKDTKIAKAKAEGRDIDAERKDMEERRLDGEGWARRDKRWQEIFENQSSKYQIILDCSFDEVMREREINSLSSQLRYCYATNKKAKHPVKTTITSLGGKTLENLQNVSGFDNWIHRAFHHTEKSVEEAFPDKSKLVYLTSDSENVLEDLEDDKVYIIGGIVDRNRLKRAAIGRAETLGIATAKLPISDYLDMVTTKVLTTNHVFDILLKYREIGKDWKKAFLDVLPHRKDLKPKNDTDDTVKETLN